MNRHIVTHTQQAVVLSLNIITEDNTGISLQTIPLVRMTTIIFVIFSLLQTVSRFWLKIQTLPHTFLNFCEWFYLLVEAVKRQTGYGRKPWQKTLAVNYGGAI